MGRPAPIAGGAAEEQVDMAAGIKAEIAKGKTPSRASMVNLLCTFGYHPKAANAIYDKQLAEWEAIQAQARLRTEAPTRADTRQR